MIVQRIKYSDYVTAHQKYEVPMGDGVSMLSEEEWNEQYGGDVVLPFAPGLPKGMTLEEFQERDVYITDADTGEKVLCAKPFNLQELPDEEAEALCKETQNRMNQITAKERGPAGLQVKADKTRPSATS